ncbi:MAG: FliO/MopB family protein [Alphaproteobacteria bacterium]|nr:FliO/MopB family protein [Alphaproteobacteria bacterium]
MAGEAPSLLKMLAALLFVLGLMGGLALVLRKFGFSGRVSTPGEKARLKIVESIPVDARRRIAIIQRDDVQHLVIFGPEGETVVETNIGSPDNKAS